MGGTFDPVYIPTDTLREAAPQWAGGTYEIFEWPSLFDNGKIKRDTTYTGQTISWREGVRRTAAWLEANDRLKDSDADDYEDRLADAWRAATAGLPKQG